MTGGHWVEHPSHALIITPFFQGLKCIILKQIPIFLQQLYPERHFSRAQLFLRNNFRSFSLHMLAKGNTCSNRSNIIIGKLIQTTENKNIKYGTKKGNKRKICIIFYSGICIVERNKYLMLCIWNHILITIFYRFNMLNW